MPSILAATCKTLLGMRGLYLSALGLNKSIFKSKLSLWLIYE